MKGSHFLIVLLVICWAVFVGCELYQANSPTNPYDPENPTNPWGQDFHLESLVGLHDEDFLYPSWSHDEALIAYSRRPDPESRSLRIYVYDMGNKSQTRQPTALTTELWETSPKWSPTDFKLAYIHSSPNNGDISIWDYPDAVGVQLTEDGYCARGSIVWSRDGEKIAYIRDDGNRRIRIISADPSRPIDKDPINPSLPGDCGGLLRITDWSPESDETPEGKLLMICEEGDAYTYDVHSGDIDLLIDDRVGSCKYGTWSANGTQLLYVTVGQTNTRELWIEREGKRAAVLTRFITKGADQNPGIMLIWNINWSRSGQSVVFEGSREIDGKPKSVYLLGPL